MSFSVQFFGQDHQALTADLLKDLCLFDQEFFHPPWSEEAWMMMLQHPQSYFIICLSRPETQQIMGFALFYLPPHAGDLIHLFKIVGHPHHRRQGIGSQLFHQSWPYLKKKGRGVYLEVEENNSTALQFYQRWSFQKLHTAKNFYGPGLHGVKMCLIFQAN